MCLCLIGPMGLPYSTLVRLLQERLSKEPNNEVAQCRRNYPDSGGDQQPNRLTVLTDEEIAGRHHYRDEEQNEDKPAETQPARHEACSQTPLFATIEPGGPTGNKPLATGFSSCLTSGAGLTGLLCAQPYLAQEHRISTPTFDQAKSPRPGLEQAREMMRGSGKPKAVGANCSGREKGAQERLGRPANLLA